MHGSKYLSAPKDLVPAAITYTGRSEEVTKKNYFAVQGRGFQAEPSESFLKCVLVANGWVRYCGSSTIFVTTSHGPPTASERTLKYSVTTAFALYGTPFLRKYPARMWVVTAFSVVPWRPRPELIHRATE